MAYDLNLYHECGGQWEPVKGWGSRYRCNKCFAFGYRKAAVYGNASLKMKAKENIIEYKCRCGQFGIKLKRNKFGRKTRQWICQKCKEAER